MEENLYPELISRYDTLMIFNTPYLRLKAWKKKYEKWLMPTFLFLGFIVDYITLNRVDTVFDNAIIIAYVILTMGTVYASHKLHFSKTELSPRLKKIQLFLPFLLQFAYGGLLSGITIFYYRSLSLTTLPFFLVLLFLFIGNDFFHQRYPKLSFQILVLSIATTAYTILLTPVVIGHMSWFVFIIGLIFGSLIMAGYAYLYQKNIPELFAQYTLKIKAIIISVIALFVFLYSTNILPPIPLSLKDAGLYSSIVRSSSDNYIFTEFEKPWYLFWSNTPRTIETTGPVYVFASVFAPKNFTEKIYHNWYFYNESKDSWQRTDRISTSIIGGRDQGFRGFTQKSNLSPGEWRVDITNSKGQIIDRISFWKK